MPNWNRPRRPPERRPKKGAPNRPSKRNRPGNRNPLRAPVHRRLGFRSHRNGGTAPDFALGSACPGTTAQHRHQRSRGTAAALSLWRFRPVSWPSRKDLRKRTGAFAPTTRLLSLCAMRERILPAGPSPGAGIVFADARRFAHDGQCGSAGELRREQRVIARIGGGGSQCQAGGKSSRSAGGRGRRR
jgi:hypothetical protein